MVGGEISEEKIRFGGFKLTALPGFCYDADLLERFSAVGLTRVSPQDFLELQRRDLVELRDRREVLTKIFGMSIDALPGFCYSKDLLNRFSEVDIVGGNVQDYLEAQRRRKL